MAPPGSSGLVDPGWEHGVAQDEKKKKVKCNYCGKIVSGGIYRLKQHLARVSGEVTYCDKTPEEVCLRMKENLERSRSNKKTRQAEDGEHAYLNFQTNDEEEDEWFRNKGKQLVVGDGNSSINFTPLRSAGYVDPGWEHGVAQDERKKKVKCKYCDKVVSGGINRFKQHLARIPGEVAPCKNAPEEVYLKIKENMKWHRAAKRQNQHDGSEMSALCMRLPNSNGRDELEEDDMHSLSRQRLIIGDRRLCKDYRKAFRSISSRNISERLAKKSRLNPALGSPKGHGTLSCKQRKFSGKSCRTPQNEVGSAIHKFFYYAGVPIQAANSLYFHKMLELVGRYGYASVSPQSELLSERFLLEEIATMKGYLCEYKASWSVTGCSIMADSWMDIEGRIVINFLVSCPRGVYFNSSVDATNIIDDAFSLFKQLDKVVEEVGEENVVQVITHNTPSYKAAGKMLEEKRKNLFWTPCATYCIEQVLEDISKMELIGECIEKGQRITRLIYNHNWLMNLMKKDYTQGQELLIPAVTRYASSFATLQNLLDHRTDLRRLFQSDKWISSRISKSDEGKEVEEIVSNSNFWKKVQYIRKSVDPLMQVLQMIDGGESLSLPYIYSYMYRAKLAIKSIHGDDARKYGPFWRAIDYHLSPLFHHPLCVAAYFFNPSYRYRPDFMEHSEVVRGVNECIVRLEPENMRRIPALRQIPDYTSAKADFGTELAISTRTELDPAAWWQQHGIGCLELQRVAVRILSHTCSSFGCEHNWSLYDQLYSQRQSCFARKNFNDLVYVHYNLRLREKQLRRRSNESISLESGMLEHLLEDWIVPAERQASQEDEEVFCKEEEAGIEDDDENNFTDIEDEDPELGRGPDGRVTFADIDDLDGDPVNAAATDADANMDFYEDDLSD